MANFDGAHVLIIEDDKVSVDVLADLLNQLGITYTVVYDGRNVLERIAQLERVDSIFLDLELPKADGYQVFEMLKSEPRLSETPVIAYSAHLSHMTDAREMGFHGFLGKPLDAHEFPSQLDRIFNKLPVWAVR
jgi:CheY-like chemotaxis protein